MMSTIKEFHLFAGIGGGIYGGELLGHECVAGVEILDYAQRVLKRRQLDGWMPKFPIFPDVTKLAHEIEIGNGFEDIEGEKHEIDFDVLCGGFPCQAFSTAAHGKNIASKNLWNSMLEFVKCSKAPIVFGENVVLRAIDKAKQDLESIGYKVERIRLSCGDLGADHRRNRFWLMAVKKDEKGISTFNKLSEHLSKFPKLNGNCWTKNIEQTGDAVTVASKDRRDQLLGIGNAQSPFVAASAFRILVNRLLNHINNQQETVGAQELSDVFEKKKTWITMQFRESSDPNKKITGLIHTPTIMANYCCNSMNKHEGCRNYVKVFCDTRPGTPRRPEPVEAEYLMGFPLGASSPNPVSIENRNRWANSSYSNLS